MERSPSTRQSSRGPVRPKDCPEFQRLFEAVEADPDLSTDEMLAMFRDVGVYGRLTEFRIILRNLLEVLGLLRERQDWRSDFVWVERWPNLLQWILAHESLLPPSKYTAQYANKNPLVNVCATSHPLYALLWTSTEPNQLQEFRLLQGHALIAHLANARRHEEYAYDYPRSNRAPYEEVIAGTYRISIALREISETEFPLRPEMLRPERPPKKFARDMLELWESVQKHKGASTPTPKGSEEDFAAEGQDQELVQYLKRASHGTSRVHLQSFCYVLAEALDLRKRRSGHSRRGKTKNRHSIQGYLPLVDPTGEDVQKLDRDDPARRPIVLRRRIEAATVLGRGNNSARRYEQEFDIDPAENIGEETVEVEVGCAVTGNFPALHTLALRGKVQAEALQNQLLPWDYNVLTDTALRSLVERMREDFEEELGKASDNPRATAKAIALLNILLWTGCGLEVARKVKVREATASRGLEKLVLEAHSTSEQRYWSLRISAPSFAAAVPREASIVADTRENLLRLPDLAQGGEYLLRLRERFPGFRDRGFTESPAYYQMILQRYLRKVDPSGYLTLAKVEDYLWFRLASAGDPAEADLLVGKRHRLAEVRRFYTTLAKDALQQRYCSVVEEIHAKLGLVVHTIDSVDTHHGYVGAVYRPTVPAVQRAAERLRLNVSEAAERMQSLASRPLREKEAVQRNYYNYYTLYTWFFFSYATAARATCRTLPTGPLPDLREGVIAYGDKTTKDDSHVRLIWLPTGLVRQLHQQRMLARSFSDLKSRDGGQEENDSNFLLLPRASPALCPKVISPYLEECFDYALPVNSHRRFCRSYLLEEGCPPEVVDAYLGHWFSGESPWSRYSSQSVLAYLEELKPYLSKMLALLGLEFIPLVARASAHQG